MRFRSKRFLGACIVLGEEGLICLTSLHTRHGVLGFDVVHVAIVFLHFGLVDGLSNFVLPEMPYPHDDHSSHKGDCEVCPSTRIFAGFIPGIDCVCLYKACWTCWCERNMNAFNEIFEALAGPRSHLADGRLNVRSHFDQRSSSRNTFSWQRSLWRFYF